MSSERIKVVLREILIESKDGEWGKDEQFEDSIMMRVIRGTDFESANVCDLSSAPIRHISARHAVRKTLKPHDILIETAGGSKGRPTGKTVYLRPSLFEGEELPITCASFARYLRIDRSIADSGFVYWYLQSLYRNGTIENYQVQHTGIARFQFTKFAESEELSLPDIHQQREAVEVLEAIEARIALLRETNATLEAIAQALFKSWFVDFDPVRAKAEGRQPEGMDPATATLFPDTFEDSELGPLPKGWHVAELGDFAVSTRAQVHQDDLHEGIHYVGLEHIPRKSLSLSIWENASGLDSAKAEFKAGDILFGKLRPYFHKVAIAPIDGVCSTDILVCRAARPEFYGLALMHLFSKELIDYADRLSNGAKMPRVNWRDIAAYPVSMPTIEVARAYTELIESLLEKMQSNIHSARYLAELRDALLPRLISGQLRLSEVQEQIEDALA